jgi:hypothetical protein
MADLEIPDGAIEESEEEVQDEFNPDDVLSELESDTEEQAQETQEEAQETSTEDSDGDDETYVIDGIEFTKKEFKQMHERNSDVKKQITNLNNWGRKLNQREKELKEQADQMEETRKLAEEYRRAQAYLKANPQAYERLKSMINEGGGEASPRIAKLEEELNKRVEEEKTESAKVSLSKEFPDFNYESLQDFVDGVDWEDRTQVMKFQWWAKLGSQLEDEIQKRLARSNERRKRQPGAPPFKGGGSSKVTGVDRDSFKSQNDYVRDALEMLRGI